MADYAIKISNSVKPPLDEELAYFEELKQKLIETGSAILELSNQTVNATQGAYIRVTEGGSTSSKDIAQASAYLSGQKLIDTKKRKDEWSDTQNSLNAQIIANQGDGAKVAELTAQMQAEEAAFNADCQAIAEKYTQDMGNMWEAIAKAYPEQVELAKGILASQNQVDLISEALGVWDNTDGNDEAAAKKAKEKIAATYQQIFGEAMFSDNYGAAEQRLREQMDAIKASMAANVENTDFSDVFTAFSAAVEGGLLENLDLSSASDGLKAMITAIDLSDDGKTMGEQLAAGQVEGIVAGTPEAEKAILENVKAICDGFKTPMEISSPSGVFERYGGYIMEGLKNGLQGGRKTVLSPLDTLTADLSLIGQNAVGGLITGADSRKQELIDAYAALGRSAAKAVRDELDIHSPSRVFAKIGIYSAEGMIAGLNARVRDVHAAMAQIADINAFSSKSRRQNDIAKAAMQSQEGQAGQPIQIIVNYTGAVSSRESRKLAQQLGGYLSGQLSVRGI